MEYKMKKIANNLQLGEGCIWDEKRNKVHYVDIEGYRIYSYSPETEETEELDMGDYVGCIVLDKENNLIAAVRNQLICVHPETGKCETMLRIPCPDTVRFNDGKCDAYGNLWVGTMALDQSSKDAKGCGTLYCIKDLEIIAQYDGFTIANGLDWNDAGDKFYHIDTETQKIDRYEVLEEGMLGHKSTAVIVDEADGAPDGMCMDANGGLWTAMWGGSKVICYDADSGKKLDEIQLPDKNVSCCAFGGRERNELYITTAQDEDGNKGGMYVAFMHNKKGKQAFRFQSAKQIKDENK